MAKYTRAEHADKCLYCVVSNCVDPEATLHPVRALVDEPGFDVNAGDEFLACEGDIIESLTPDPMIEVLPDTHQIGDDQ